MRPGPVLLISLTLVAAALLPGMALAAGDHAGHGSDGPANPMVKSLVLYLDGAGGLGVAPAGNAEVPAGPAMPTGESAPVAWIVEATHNTLLDSSVFVEVFAKVTAPTVVAGGPEGAAFLVQLLHNGEPVEGASSLQKVASGVLTPSEENLQIRLFIPQVDLALAPGDTIGVAISYYGLNTEALPAIAYVVGGDQGSRIGFRLRMASLSELSIPKEAGPWAIAPLEGFDFAAAAKKSPDAKVFTLKAFQFGFHGAPIVVPNGTQVILQLTIDETLSTAGEGHEAHAHGDTNASWDQNIVAPLHGFSLQSYDPALSTVLFDGLVTTLTFHAERPGNYTFMCTVFCGSGHGTMLDRLTIEGPVGNVTGADGQPLEQTQNEQSLGPDKATPGPSALAGLAGIAAVALAARRRKA
jgi:hypothetical protein